MAARGNIHGQESNNRRVKFKYHPFYDKDSLIELNQSCKKRSTMCLCFPREGVRWSLDNFKWSPEGDRWSRQGVIWSWEGVKWYKAVSDDLGKVSDGLGKL